MYYQLNIRGIRCLRSNNSIYHGFDSTIREYTHANTVSIRNLLSRVEHPDEYAKYINQLEQVCYVYIYKWSVEINGIPFFIHYPSIDIDQYQTMEVK